jgi:hypothetical protein
MNFFSYACLVSKQFHNWYLPSPHFVVKQAEKMELSWYKFDSFSLVSEYFDAVLVWLIQNGQDHLRWWWWWWSFAELKYRIMACLITMHIPDINPKFCIVNEILFLSSPLNSTYLFWFSRPKLRFFLSFNILSILPTNKFLFFLQSRFRFLQLFFLIYIWLNARAPKFLSSVVFWPVSSFVIAISSFMFGR